MDRRQAVAGPAGRPANEKGAMALSALLAAALVLRVAAANNDLWVDEIFSLREALRVNSFAGVFTGIHSDNNHYLTTLWMVLLGDQPGALGYRAFSIACGVLAVAAAWWVGARRGVSAALLFAGMVATSYALVHYSSEARGYSGAVLAGIVAFGAAERWIAQRSGRWMILFAAASLFGLLSHLTFAFVLAALAAWLLVEAMQGSKAARGRALVAVGGMLAPALACVAILYAVDLRFMGQLGGPKLTPAFVVTRLLALTAGWPWRDAWSPVVAIAMTAGIMGWQLWRFRGQRQGIFYAVLFGVPASLLLIHPPTYLFPRYFLVLVPFAYLLAAEAGARGIRAARWRPWVMVLGLAFLAGQAALLLEFLKVGRGDLSAATAYLAEHTDTPQIGIIAATSPRRAEVELAYCQRFLPAGRSLVMVKDLSQGAPPWLLMEDVDVAAAPPIVRAADRLWEKRAGWPGSELSGQAWVLYHQVGPASP